jgi:hypothetical protein
VLTNCNLQVRAGGFKSDVINADLSKCYVVTMMDEEQSRAKQSRAEQSRAKHKNKLRGP